MNGRIEFFRKKLRNRATPNRQHGKIIPLRMGGRVVKCTSLENWQGGNSFVGSNPTLSAICFTPPALFRLQI